jgi:hypothetical protein
LAVLLRINPAKNLWHCLGACNEGGAIEWVMRADGISFRHAVELLRADHLPLAAGKREPPRKGTITKLPAPIDRNGRVAQALNLAETQRVPRSFVFFAKGRVLRTPAVKFVFVEGRNSCDPFAIR